MAFRRPGEPVGVGVLVAIPNDPSAITTTADWTSFDVELLRTCSSVPFIEDHFLDTLAALIRLGRIVAKCKLCSSTALVIRIYLVPFGPLDLDIDHSKLFSKRAIRTFSTILFKNLVISKESWEGITQPDGSFARDSFGEVSEEHFDSRGLADVFSDLTSWRLGPLEKAPEMVAETINSTLSCSSPTGMRSQLYKYQRETVAKMVELESDNRVAVNPLFLKLNSPETGRSFYLQPILLEVTMEPPLMAQGRGGILAEELGTGKTCMLLGLILATKGALSQPEESLLESRPILTPISHSLFHGEEYVKSRAQLRPPLALVDSSKSRLPTLVETILHNMRIMPRLHFTSACREELKRRNLWKPLLWNTPYYHHNDAWGLTGGERARSKGAKSGIRRVYLTTATLILVPSHLLIQWTSEINKHCDQEALSVLTVRTSGTLPSASILASSYDIVLMTHTRFASEVERNDLQKVASFATCRCRAPETPIRIPNCTCNSHPNVSPLLQIRWKRLVVDEGHIVANSSANLATLASVLSVESRWIVTGTPTTNLLGLNFGKEGKEDEELDEPSSDLLDLGLDPRAYPSDEAGEPSASTPSDVYDANTASQEEKWSSLHRVDLRKLASMMTHFLKLPQFSAEPKSFLSIVVEPLLRKSGNGFGSVTILKQVMEQFMIRHSVREIEAEVQLPPLQKRVVSLDLDMISQKTYNVLQSSIAVNAIDSERKDIDYLFHPSNSGALLRLMASISQTLFWHIDPNALKVDDALKNATSSLQRAIDRGMSSDDINLLHDSIYWLKSASSDIFWREVLCREEVPYQVTGLPEPVAQAWSHFSADGLSQNEDLRQYHYLRPDRLLRLRRSASLFSGSLENLIQDGQKAVEEDIAREHYLQELEKRKKNGKRKRDELEIEKNKAKVVQKVAEVTSPQRPVIPALGQHDETLLEQTSVSRPISSKLNWILREVLAYPTEKFLIFSASPLTLAHVAEGLDVVGIPHLLFSSATHRKAREHLPTSFETSDRLRAFLMELKHGARGLNLTSASRVIFCEPVWHADVESQAIKRVHRIGQTKPVIVQTLAIRSSFEEVMVTRDRSGHAQGHTTKALTDEPGMRAFIKASRFSMMNNCITEKDTESPIFGKAGCLCKRRAVSLDVQITD
ncbi:hypothetical protein SISNIDRAFT_488820 [Sistotremastrum niveocremeum HHB9708]|uniref:P-loop containing nucleoside triphosphate hydrolase protein n=1 Tax=Sistotremastrum niveocremeum HHB9708 TaxID=1314777 RepID=A0A164QTS8_9AGAM|nr:hypothetical protein SISNIDRAFT_488820 [Sistotremastrum niveocremeum HHB9708]